MSGLNKNRRPPQNPMDGKGEDRYSSAVANATDAVEKHPTDPTNPVSIIAGYARLGESLRAAGNFRKVAMEIAKIAELAETTVMEETSDWFDAHTVKRNMSELKKHAGAFSKLAEELDTMQQRASALYDDMGNVLGRYFEMADLEPVSSAINNPEDKGEEGFSPEDRAPEFDGPGGNPEDDEGRRKHDAQDGSLDDVAPTALSATHTTDTHPSDVPGVTDIGDSEDEDEVLEGIVNRIMEKLVPETDQDDYEDYQKRVAQKRKGGMTKGGRAEAAISERGGPADAQRAHKALRTPESFARPHQGFTHDQAKEILKRTGTNTVEGAQKMMDAANDKANRSVAGSGSRPSTLQKKEEALRQIVAHHQNAKIQGERVDAQTANIIVKVLDALNDTNKQKFLNMPIKKMAEFAWSMAKR